MVSLCGRGFDSLQLHHLSKCKPLTFRKLADFFVPCIPSFFSFWGRSRGRKTGSLEPNLVSFSVHVSGLIKNRQHPRRGAACCCFNKSNPHYETSMALVTFSFGSVFGMVMVRMPSSTLAEIWSRTTSSGNV